MLLTTTYNTTQCVSEAAPPRAAQATMAEAQAYIEELEAAYCESQAARQRLEAQVAEAQAVIEHLLVENQRQQQELEDYKQKPFRSRRRKRQSSASSQNTKRGAQPGHAGHGRPRPQRIDETKTLPAGDACPACGTPFTGEGVTRERVIEDIIPVRPTRVIRYVIERRWCPECRTYHEAPVTAALPHCRLGLRVMLFVVYQKVIMGLSYRKIQRELALYFQLDVSRGELPRIVDELAQRFGPAYRQLIDLLRQQHTLHVDETGWRVDGDNHWLWVFVNDVIALYLVSHSRGSKVPKALLGADFEGTVISDFFSAYAPLEMEKAKCWAHLLRDSHDLTKGKPPPDGERVEFHTTLHQLFLDMSLARQACEGGTALPETTYQELRQKLYDFAATAWNDGDCQRLAKRILKHLDELLVWLRDPAVPPDNNMAERSLRPAVITRKTSFGSRSHRGALAFARLLSLIQTWERQGQDFFSTALSILEAVCS